jgi:hypothetical protein
MLQAPLEDVGDGLKAAVRMVGSALRLARTKRHGAQFVEQQERVEVLQGTRREGPVDQKTLAFIGLHTRENPCNRSAVLAWYGHVVSLSSCASARTMLGHAGRLGRFTSLGGMAWLGVQ